MTHFFDRTGKPLELLEWAYLFEDASYRFVQRTWVQENVIEVFTMWEGFDPYSIQLPARIFRIDEVHWSWTDRKTLKSVDTHHMVATEAEAAIAHHDLVEFLRGMLDLPED